MGKLNFVKTKISIFKKLFDAIFNVTCSRENRTNDMYDTLDSIFQRTHSLEQS